MYTKINTTKATTDATTGTMICCDSVEDVDRTTSIDVNDVTSDNVAVDFVVVVVVVVIAVLLSLSVTFID